MGFPIRSNIFKLGTTEQRRFASYPLQAAVLFSAADHRDFADSFRELFTRLDHLTGKDVVFFALLDPPASWLQTPHGRVWAEDWLHCGGDMGLGYEDHVVLREIGRTFRVSWDELPVLVVSPNLWLGEYCVVSTEAVGIEAQFRTLVDVVRRWGRPNLGLLQDALSVVAGVPAEVYTASELVRQRLVSTYEFAEAAAAQQSRVFADQLEREVRATQQSLAHARRAVPEGGEHVAMGPCAEGFDSLAEDAAGRLIVPATLAAKYLDVIRLEAPFPLIELLDQESAVMLDTSLRVGSLLETLAERGPTLGIDISKKGRPHSQFRARSADFALDFAPGASGAWRALEREVNLSVIPGRAAREGGRHAGPIRGVRPDIARKSGGRGDGR